LGARVLERHFTSDKSWPGPDVPISMDPAELRDLVVGSRAIFEASGGGKTILPEERPTIDFAYACVVTTRAIAEGEALSGDNTWVKRPGTGEIKARDFERVLGRVAGRPLPAHTQVSWKDLR
jgi:N-acetylneuraminate synthase